MLAVLCLASFPSSFGSQGGFHNLWEVSSDYPSLPRSLSVILHLSPLLIECRGQLAVTVFLSMLTCLVLVLVFACFLPLEGRVWEGGDYDICLVHHRAPSTYPSARPMTDNQQTWVGGGSEEI